MTNFIFQSAPATTWPVSVISLKLTSPHSSLLTPYFSLLTPFPIMANSGFKDAEVRHAVFLRNALDLGEASVIQLALDENIHTVCIDESMGRRIARLNGLKLTGSVGVLIRAKKDGFGFSMSEAINRTQSQGIYLSQKVVDFALKQVNEM